MGIRKGRKNESKEKKRTIQNSSFIKYPERGRAHVFVSAPKYDRRSILGRPG